MQNRKQREFITCRKKQNRISQRFRGQIPPVVAGNGFQFPARYVAELKVWRGEAAQQAGLRQLAGYRTAREPDRGYLVVLDHGSVNSWKHEQIELDKKQIFAVWV